MSWFPLINPSFTRHFRNSRPVLSPFLADFLAFQCSPLVKTRCDSSVQRLELGGEELDVEIRDNDWRRGRSAVVIVVFL